MESDLQQHQHQHHHLRDLQHQHPKQLNSGLTRYQSAPSSYFSSFLDRELCEDFLNRPSSPETERIFARFLSNASGNSSENNNNMSDQNLGQIQQNSPVREKLMESELQQQQQTSVNNNQSGIVQQQQQQKQRNYSASQSFYQNQSQQNLQNPNSGSGMDYGAMKMATGGNNSNLIRHSSSPAGLFANLEIENGYVVMTSGMGDYGNSNNREASFASAAAGRPPASSSGPMSPISELGNKGNTGGGFIEDHSSNYSTGFPVDSWDEDSIMSDNVTGVKRLREDDRTLSAGLTAETQNLDAGHRRPPLLAHHLSLPKDLTAIEKILQFQDSVPCKIRAKRGCATHPRSIAERVRRTKISERMRKLQDLVPNMDKQTNTADMLDLAVDYVKELQTQVKALSDKRVKCTCSNKQEQQ
ncbi:hypothetical protein ACOSQ2_017568 [Xanthoceras sorbifolium]